MTSAIHARKAKLKGHLVSAKAKVRQHVTPRGVLLFATAACSAYLLLITVRTLHSAAVRGGASAAGSSSVAVHDSQQQRGGCAKLPAAVAVALVHYATSNETPRQTETEAGAAARVLARRAPCNLLVFGLGADSALWAALNHGGRTLFLDDADDADRIASVRAAARPAGLDLEAHHVVYYQLHANGTVALANDDGADEILALRDSSDCTVSSSAKPLSPEHLERSPCKLAPRGLPAAFYEAEWDLIMVNAPVASAIYTAGIAARARRPETGETTDVLVHGVDSPAEERFTRAFLCERYIKEAVGKTRHFAIPSHRGNKEATTFCP